MVAIVPLHTTRFLDVGIMSWLSHNWPSILVGVPLVTALVFLQTKVNAPLNKLALLPMSAAAFIAVLLWLSPARFPFQLLAFCYAVLGAVQGLSVGWLSTRFSGP